MTIKIFSYKGKLGATSDTENGTFMNDIKNGNQLGVVVDVEHITITEEAKPLFTKLPRVGGSFAGCMLTKSDKGGYSVGLLGFGAHAITEIGRTCDLSVVDEIKVDNEIEVPQDFKDFVDGVVSE